LELAEVARQTKQLLTELLVVTLSLDQSLLLVAVVEQSQA
jgi:hypothetical protein